MKEPKLDDLRDEPSPFQNREARNQKQHNWDVLRRFGKAVGGFLTNSVSEINNAISNAGDRMDDIEDRYNQQIAGNTELSEIIDSRDNFKTLGERLNQTMLVSDSIDATGGFNADFKAEIDETRNKINDSNFNLLLMTDLHYEQNNPKGYGAASAASLKHVSNAMQLESSVDVMVAGGDNNHSLSKSLSAIKQQVKQVATAWLLTGNHADKFMLIGNHDNGSMRTGDKWLNRPLKPTDVISEAYFKEAYMTGARLFKETRDEDSLFFIKDYPTKHIRLVGVNSLDDTSRFLDDNGNLKYLNQWDFAILQQQFNFLIKELSNTPAELHTIFVAHVQADPATVHFENHDEFHHNYDILIRLIEAFKDGRKLSEESTGDFAVKIEADFTAQGPRSVVGFFNGHTHKELITPEGTFKDIHCLNSICDGENRELNNPNNEDAFTIISIDTIKKHINLIGFGAAADREVDYD